MKKFIGFILMVFVAVPLCFAADDYWVKPMTDVHKKFKGEKGMVALYGDSITYVDAFWTPIKGNVKNSGDIGDEKLKKVSGYIQEKSWNLKGESNGNKIGWSIRNGIQTIDKYLPKHNPEVAIVMFGGNDVERGNVKERRFEEEYTTFVNKILDNGTIVIISTMSPRRGCEENVKDFNDVIKKIAKEKGLPLIDYYGEVLKRRPSDWIGTLIDAKDGLHPTTKAGGEDWSVEGLKNSGYQLRNYIVMKKYIEVYDRILSK